MKYLNYISSFIKGVIRFISGHYTWLSVLVIGLIMTAGIYLVNYFFRYSHYRYWMWKGKARKKTAGIWITLIIIKILIKVLK